MERKVVVGMSGGVDSTVTALLLQKTGYEVHGIFLRLWKHANADADDDSFTTQYQNLMTVAEQIGIQFQVIDARKRFRESVVQYFLNGYQAGLTPNPCYFCNRNLKWQVLLEEAERLGAQAVASGHYAQIETDEKGTAHLFRGLDPLKDQSYVLSSLRQDQLRRILFPLGQYTKTQVREIAKESGLKIPNSGESQDICFLPQGEYGEFIRGELPAIENPGEIIDAGTGQVIGQHRGLAFYTIGQRKGLGIYAPTPTYVVDKLVDKNQLIVGPIHALGRSSMVVSDINWISGFAPEQTSFSCDIEIRYHSHPYRGNVTLSDTAATVEFDHSLRDITPGQAAVFYIGNEVLGSGMIKTAYGDGGKE